MISEFLQNGILSQMPNMGSTLNHKFNFGSRFTSLFIFGSGSSSPKSFEISGGGGNFVHPHIVRRGWSQYIWRLDTRNFVVEHNSCLTKTRATEINESMFHTLGSSEITFPLD